MTRNPESRTGLRIELLLAAVLVAFVIASRLFIDVPNFKPVMAVAMLAGFLFHRKSLGILTIVVGMLVSDFLIGFYDWRVSSVVYSALVLPMIAGITLRSWEQHAAKFFAGVVGFAGLSSILFYVSTTVSVWLCYPWYSNDLQGMMTAFAYGLPFFKWTLCGNVLFSLLLFGAASLFRTVGDAMQGHRDRKMVPVKVRR